MDVSCPKCGAAVTEERLNRDFGGMCPACLADFALADADAPKIPGIDIVGRLGRGGMGVVYRGRQVRLGRDVAVKVLDKALTEDSGFVERFHREARAMASLNHPNIVTIHDFGDADGVYYLIIEYVDGANLRSILQQKLLTSEQALQIIPQLCDALHYAHGQGVIHRDLKPENILVDKSGRVKIADYGIAKMVGAPGPTGLTGSLDVMGTMHYMAPEQYENPKTVDHRADIYSLGVMFYEMLTGELPLGRFAAPSKKAAVDVRLDEVVFKALEKDPAQRYQHASQVREDVTRIRPGPPPAPESAPQIGPVRKRLTSPASVVLLGLFVASVGLLGLAAALSELSTYGLALWIMAFLVGAAVYALVMAPAVMDAFHAVGHSRALGLVAVLVGTILVFCSIGAGFSMSRFGPRSESMIWFCADGVFVVVVAALVLTGPRRRAPAVAAGTFAAAEYVLLTGVALALVGFLVPWSAGPLKVGDGILSNAPLFAYHSAPGWAMGVASILICVGIFVSRPAALVHRLAVGQTFLGVIGFGYFVVQLCVGAETAVAGLYLESAAYAVILIGAMMRLRSVKG